MHQAIFGQPKGHDRREYGQPGKNKRDNDVQTYVEARLFQWISVKKLIELIKLNKLNKLTKLSVLIELIELIELVNQSTQST